MNKWNELLANEYNKPYYLNLIKKINEEYENYTVYPAKENIFKALEYTDYDDVKVVIIGQDPYHEENQAQGLAFSVPDNQKLPPSLKNIFKEIENELGIKNSSGDLTKWSQEGVLLINTVLTVRAGLANSHKGYGWEEFTSAIIQLLNKRNKPIIFLLWGNDAIKKKELITNKNHFVLTSAHPSPLSAYHGFFGNDHFKKTNEILISIGEEPIDWQL